MMRSFIKFFILTLFCSTNCFSQTGTVEGYISDADLRSPLYGATVNIGTTKSDDTDQFGRFVISGVNPGQYELIVSHIGYKTEIVPVEVRSKLLSTVNVDLRKTNLDLSEVKVNGKRNSALNTIGAVDIQLRPVNTSQDVLRIVPGLFIAQHAGGGKAEQIFLRGYDIDHGTDINITVDGMPVNMVSHAHGQGYADLHFLIPETVEKAGFDKGPYFASKGNLATAAYVEFQTKDLLTENLLRFEAGRFNSQKATALLKVFNKESDKKREQFYIASEYSHSDGYFDSPQKFHRFNIMGKYNAWFGNQSQLTITASTFDSKWNASGQVPERAVQDGTISRFGSIDDSEGGNTNRTNVTAKFSKNLKNNWKISNQAYYINYHFNLYSNFTFFLNDNVNGDGIDQRETRDIIGNTFTAGRSLLLGKRRMATEFGAGFRHDNVKDIALMHTVKRVFLNDVQKGDLKETNLFAYINQDIELSDKWNLNAGLRYDHFKFQYKDKLIASQVFNDQTRGTVSPKLNLSYTPNQKIKIYLSNGIGFHSNDTRVILDDLANDILPKVYASDLGIIIKPVKNLIIKTALWHLYSQQEFVYVGDEGIVEAGGKTRRIGIDLSARYQFAKWLFGDIDINLTKARAIGEPKGEDHVPLAPSFTSIGGLTAKAKNGFSGSLRYRFIDKRPANEDYSVTAQGYFITDALISYQWKKWEIKAAVENLFDVKWREAQFDTESQLQTETAPVSEIHYTPGSPRFLKAGISFHF